MELLRAIAAVEPNYLRMAVAGVIIVIAIVVPIELFKYIKDAYYFRTLNWSAQWRCRQSMSLMKGAMMYHMDICTLDREFSNEKRHRCLTDMRKLKQ